MGENFDIFFSDNKDNLRLLNELSDGFWYCNVNNPEKVFTESEFWPLLGYTLPKDQNLFTLWAECVHPEDLAYFHQNIKTKPDKFQQELRFYHKDGSTLWLSMKGLKTKKINNNEILLLGVFINITKLKLQQEALEKASVQRSIINELLLNTNDLIVILNRDFIITDLFKTENTTALNKKALVGAKFEDTDLPSTLKSTLVTVLYETAQTRVTISAECDFFIDNQRKYYKIIVYPSIDDQGKIEQVTCHIQNINKPELTSYEQSENSGKTKTDIQQQELLKLQLSESEEKFQQLLNSTGKAIFGIDANGTCTFCNPACIELLGYKKAEQLMGKNMHLLIHHSYADGSLRSEEDCKVNVVLESGEGIHVSNEVVWRANNTNFHAEYWAHPLFASGKITGAVITFQDISDRIVAEEKLKEDKMQAETASKAKSEFLANISHEIRTPLNGVIGFSDLLMQTGLNSTQQKYNKTIYQSATSLLDIINDILDFSKIEAGKLELNIEKLDLPFFIEQAQHAINYQLYAKKLKLLVKIDTDVPKYVFADELRLKQVLVNLLSNAIKFTNKGTIQIKISLIKTYKDSRVQLRFSVKDRGIGISAENQQKIFEAFTQEDASTTKRFGGTGLGLTISNKILALMESKLHVDSHLGKGSLFYFDVVFRASYDEDNTLDDIEHIKHALIVDDNPTSRKLLKDLLALKKITYTEVKNGIEALQIIKENTEVFDVIFMDYQMPYLNGLETIGYFRENYSNYDTPIILLNSMLNDEKINESVKQLDIEQVLMKPISFKSLYAALSKISAKKQDFDKKIPVHKDAFTIIIAEDNNVNITLTETIIKNIYPNATILLASNGREALTLFKLHQPDLIFMDIQMPVMNGYNATKAIKSLEEVHQTPVIALTGGVLKGEVENCLKAGMDDYIPKPITKNKIQSMILKWLQKSKNIKGKSKVVHQEVNNEMRYNLKELYDKIDQDEAFLNIILKKTKTYWDNILSTLNVALENDDLVEVKQIAHKLKGSSLNLCFNKLASLASKIEKYEGNNMNTVSQYIDTIDEEINFLKEKIFVEKGMQN